MMLTVKAKWKEGPRVPHNNNGLDTGPKETATMQIGSLIFSERNL